MSAPPFPTREFQLVAAMLLRGRRFPCLLATGNRLLLPAREPVLRFVLAAVHQKVEYFLRSSGAHPSLLGRQVIVLRLDHWKWLLRAWELVQRGPDSRRRRDRIDETHTCKHRRLNARGEVDGIEIKSRIHRVRTVRWPVGVTGFPPVKIAV